MPCARKSAPPIFFASVSNTSMKRRPMVLRFNSGSVTPASSPRKSFRRIHVHQRDVVVVPEQVDHGGGLVPCAALPWSTNTQVSWSPIASWISTAATAESTPPERPQITRPLPTWARIFSIASSRKARMVQSPVRPATLRTKLRISLAPSGVCTTSGVEHQPVIFSRFVLDHRERRVRRDAGRRQSRAAF